MKIYYFPNFTGKLTSMSQNYWPVIGSRWIRCTALQHSNFYRLTVSEKPIYTFL